MTLTKTKGFYFPPGSPPEKNREKNFDLRALGYFMKVHDGAHRKRRIAVQAGGNIGVWPSALAKWFDLVLTFEPYMDCFHCLCLNCGEQNVIPFRAALGNRPGLCEVYGKLIGSHRVKRIPGVKHTQPMVPEITLDSLNLPYCDALLLDVEGYEYRAIAGARVTIRKFLPTILIEERRKLKQADPNEPLPGKLLEDWGYKRMGHLAGDGIYLAQ